MPGGWGLHAPNALPKSAASSTDFSRTDHVIADLLFVVIADLLFLFWNPILQVHRKGFADGEKQLGARQWEQGAGKLS
jgi:hypothetical protein